MRSLKAAKADKVSVVLVQMWGSRISCQAPLSLHSQDTVDREVAVLVQLKDRYQKLTGETLPSAASDKKKLKEKSKQQQIEVKGAAGKKESKKQQQKQAVVVKEEGEAHKKITR